jgi:hypothetical protein
MTEKTNDLPETDASTPFGSHPQRTHGLLIFLGVLYVIWFLVLLWMALFQTGR